MGNNVEAIKLGEEALKKAPNDEARARFTQFIDSVKNNRQGVGPQSANSEQGAAAAVDRAPSATADTAQAGSADAPVAGSNPPIDAVVRQVKDNPVAGPKFARFEVADGGATVKLFFNQFPMEAMPPFVRDKFLNKMKDAGRGGALKTIIILDADQGTEMARVSP